MEYAGIIFAGGQAKRLGGRDKGGLMLGGVSCLERVISVLSPLTRIAISGADIQDWPAPAGERRGVVFGLLGAAQWARDQGYAGLITSSVDTPFLPQDYVERLLSLKEERPVVSLSSSGVHGLHALWPAECFDALKDLVLERGERQISSLHTALNSRQCVFETGDSDPFFNINTAEDLVRAETLAKAFNL